MHKRQFRCRIVEMGGGQVTRITNSYNGTVTTPKSSASPEPKTTQAAKETAATTPAAKAALTL